jgi:hypothetical protein
MDDIMSEAQFQKRITDSLTAHGWGWHHNPDSRWVLAGMPDLMAWRPGEFLFIEVKKQGGRLSKIQHERICELEGATCEVWVVWPKDWSLLAERISRSLQDRHRRA